jgi:hypothetical protein
MTFAKSAPTSIATALQHQALAAAIGAAPSKMICASAGILKKVCAAEFMTYAANV